MALEAHFQIVIVQIDVLLNTVSRCIRKSQGHSLRHNYWNKAVNGHPSRTPNGDVV